MIKVNKTHKNIIVILLVLISAYAVVLFLFPYSSQKEKLQNTRLPNDIRWVVKSDEYKMLAEQVYRNATQYVIKVG